MEQNYNIEQQMSEQILKRREIFRANVHDPSFNEPIKALTRDYSAGIVFFIKDLFWTFKIGRRRIFKLNY